ncbi:MAG TPA: S9 family peptidase [Terricaulis sp.]|nr:S9 family peptidase [Terricaulis sp.]
MKLAKCAAAACALVFAAMFSVAAHAQTPPPVEAYGRLPAVSDVAISPDGQRLVIAAFEDGRSQVRILNIASGAIERVSVAPPGTKLRGVSWADNDRVLFYVSAAIDPRQVMSAAQAGSTRVIEYWRTGVFSRTTGRQEYLTLDDYYNWAQIGLTAVRAPIASEPGAARMIAYSPTSGRLGVFRVHLDGGRPQPVASGQPDTVDIILDEAGGMGGRIDVNQSTNHWRVFLYENGRARQVMEGDSEFGETPYFPGFLPDGRAVYLDRLEDDRVRFFALNGDGQSEMLVENERYDVGGAMRDPWSHRVVGAAWTEDLSRQRFFEADLQAAYERLRTRLGDTEFHISTWSQDRSRLVVSAEINGAGGYYLYEPAGDAMRPIAEAYPELRSTAAIGTRQSITYRARDGQRIPAYLTLPGDGAERNLPLVLLVHGGPHARDTHAFDWWASFLASRGYAVLQPNYRGSTGYGHAWFDAGRGGWGEGVMQTDVEDGMDALVRAGIADGSRVCIIGASYGGYAALAGATITPDRYRCAAAIAGVSDLIVMQTDSERGRHGRRGGAAEWWRLSMGDRREDPEMMRRISPARNAERVQVPVLLMHGVDDTVVPIAQSRLMRDRLRSAGKPVEYFEMQGDDHWLSNAETRTQMLRELERFLGQHLQPQ